MELSETNTLYDSVIEVLCLCQIFYGLISGAWKILSNSSLENLT